MGGDGKMVENAASEVGAAQRIANEVTAPKFERACPKNHVARTLNARDRNNILAAAFDYIQKNRNPKEQKRFRFLSDLLRLEETRSFFDMTYEDLQDRIADWAVARTRYRLWREVNSGMKSLEDAKKELPVFEYDPKSRPERPSPSAPQYTEDEKTGAEETFFVPNRLDDWTKMVLEKMEWDTVETINNNLNEGLASIYDKYGITRDEDIYGEEP